MKQKLTYEIVVLFCVKFDYFSLGQQTPEML